MLYILFFYCTLELFLQCCISYFSIVFWNSSYSVVYFDFSIVLWNSSYSVVYFDFSIVLWNSSYSVVHFDFSIVF